MLYDPSFRPRLNTPRRGAAFRPQVEVLEGRVQPGDALIAGLLAGALGAANFGLLDPVTDPDGLWSGPGHHRALHVRRLEAEGHSPYLAFLPSGGGHHRAIGNSAGMSPRQATVGTPTSPTPDSSWLLTVAVNHRARLSGVCSIVPALAAVPNAPGARLTDMSRPEQRGTTNPPSAVALPADKAIVTPATITVRALPADVRFTTHGGSARSGSRDAAFVWTLVSSAPGEARGVAVDAAGNNYVTGFVDTGDPVQGVDAFVWKIDTNGNDVYFAVFGGPGRDEGHGIAVDGAGEAFVTGVFDNQGDHDAFAVKLNPAGDGFVYALAFGSPGPDSGNGIAANAVGEAYVVGVLGTAPNASALHVKVSADGSGLVYAVGILFGGEGPSAANAVAYGADGYTYVTGSLTFRQASKPVVYKIADPIPDPLQLAWSWRYDTPGNGSGNGITLDACAAYVVGTVNDGANMLLAKHARAAPGEPIWAWIYEEPGGQIGGNGIAVNHTQNPLVAGYVLLPRDNVGDDALDAEFSSDGSEMQGSLMFKVLGPSLAFALAWYPPEEQSTTVVGTTSAGGTSFAFAAKIVLAG
jgi:hypothetical protein